LQFYLSITSDPQRLCYSEIKVIKLKPKTVYTLGLVVLILLLPAIWLRGGFRSLYLDLDTARDLGELSSIWLGKIVWLGPALSSGFHITSLYYYLFYPALWLAGGNARAIIVFNMVLAAAALGWFGWLGKKRFQPAFLLAMAAIGLTPWWQKISLYPGNGHTYAIFLLAGLTALWRQAPFWLSSLLIGIAVAFHPAAIFAVPILLYEWWSKKQDYLKNFLFMALGLIAPWAPYLIFIIITRGYWLRHSFTEPSLVVQFSLNFKKNLENLVLLSNLSGFQLIWFVLVWLGIGLTESIKRLKIWYGLTSLFLVLLLFVAPLADRYLFGILALVSWIVGLSLATKKWGWLVLVLAVIILGIRTATTPLEVMDRSIPVLESRIQTLIEQGYIRKEQKLAVLTALKGKKNVTPPGGAAPQSHDYRFFLRTKGYQALEVPDYAQADVLIMVLEDPTFDWHTWRSWEISEFGVKELRLETMIEQAKVVVFDKKR
jgi:hypothetical protein